MEVTFNIDSLTRQPDSEIVTKVSWSLTGVQNGATHTVKGVVDLDPPSDNPTPFSELTRTQVLDWFSVRFVGTLESAAVQLADALNPPEEGESVDVPW